MITPDFFHGHFPPKGMHGYKPDDIDTYGALILSGPNAKNSFREYGKLTDARDIIIYDMLNL